PGQSGVSPRTYLRLTSVMSSDEGRYFVVFSNSFGSATSRVAYLTVLLRPPVIVSDPASAQVCEGAEVTLYATALGSFPLHYQWQLNGTNLPAGEGFFTECFCIPETPWSISAAGPSNSGDYRVVLTNSFGARTTAVAQVTINTSPPVLSSMVTTQSVLAGES